MKDLFHCLTCLPTNNSDIKMSQNNLNEPTLFIDEAAENKTETTKMTYKKPKDKFNWYIAPAFLLFWFVLFFAVVIPIFYHLPDGLTIDEESKHEREFIAERAEKILFDFDRIGPKVVGSYANENQTVQLLLNEIKMIEDVMLDDIFEMDVDVQKVSGAYLHWTMINMYQGLQNVVVKFSAKNSTSNTYLLINSHFDSKPGSPGSGDDGAMVVIMLEILRVLATTNQTFTHPIIFLFNGAEENPLQGSHGFITQHKWAKNCKALINLDSAGSGNKELLFQSGPNHPWLMNIYRQHVKRPFATTLAEELFQSNVLPSDTDFRIFKNFGKLPGLDMAHVYNGYVYHTAFDKANIIPRGTLQSTGDNVLALARAFADSDILADSSDHAKGHTVFYDFLRLFFVYYTETVGQIINALVSLICIITVFFNIWLMTKSSHLTNKRILGVFGLIFLLHFFGIILAFGLPILIGVIFDAADSSMTWFTNRWLAIGLYICPSLFGLSAPTLFYLSLSRNDKLSQPFRLQMVLHSHCLLLSIICFIITFFGYRSSYMLMLSLAFYLCAVLLNLITTLYRRKYYWAILILLSQIMTFLYFSYVFYAFFCVLTHMMGRFGTAINPDILIGGLCALATVLSMGFVIPLLNIFRRPILILTSLAVVTLIFVIFAVTPLGFPYRAKTNVGRVNFMAVRRVFYEYDGSVSLNESGYYFDFQDRRLHYPFDSSLNLTNLMNTGDDCNEQMMCGFPLFNHRMIKSRKHGRWLPREEPIELPDTPALTLINKAIDKTGKTILFDFELKGPPHMGIFLQPMEGVKTIEWSFLPAMIKNTDKYQPPYHISFSYGNDNSTLKFFFVFEKHNGNFDEPLFELGISRHYISYEYERDAVTKNFLKSFPKYVYVMEWPSFYERYIY